MQATQKPIEITDAPIPLASSLASRPISALSVAACAVALSLSTACDMGTGETDGGTEPDLQEISVIFSASVDGTPFACDQTYPAIGTEASTVSPLDFRFYVHDVELINADGDAVAITLENDGKWQTDRVTLLDFENAGNECANGNADTNDKVFGTVPAGDYDGLQFKVGVPFEDNHADVTLAPSPLNIPSMFWNWNGGYKFMRIDSSTTGLPGGFNIHVGSTGCDGDMSGNVTECTNGNRPNLSFPAFDPASDVVDLDLAEMLAGVDVDTNTPDTPPGCMSAPGDPECTSIFNAIGIDDAAGSAFSVK